MNGDWPRQRTGDIRESLCSSPLCLLRGESERKEGQHVVAVASPARRTAKRQHPQKENDRKNPERGIRKLADQNFALLKTDPRHPSLHLKKVGRHWSVRVGDHYRAVGVRSPQGILWYWIGSHAEYDHMKQ